MTIMARNGEKSNKMIDETSMYSHRLTIYGSANWYIWYTYDRMFPREGYGNHH